MTAPVMMPNCPSDETLAAFIDGRLTGDARQRMLEHVSVCSECRDVFQTAHEIAEESGEQADVVPMRRSWLIPAATLAAAAAIGAVVFLGPAGDGYRRERYTREITAASANLNERPIHARPSIEIAYKDRSRFRGGGAEKQAELSMTETAMRLVNIADKRPTAANLHAAGVACLLVDDDLFKNAAIEYLEKALAEMPNNPDVLNDLAAAYDETNDKRARETIERAWQLKKSPNIAWTRATILGTDQAWRDYLAIDPNSAWSAEVREKHLFDDQIGN